MSLFGYRVDGVVANRIFPTQDADEWRTGWISAQDEVLDQVVESFAGLPLWRSSTAPANRWVSRRSTTSPRRCTPTPTRSRARTGAGRCGSRGRAPGPCVHLALPYVTRDEVGLARHGDELVVTVASYRRLLTLPPGLGRHQIAGARVVGGELQVRFKEGAS